MTPEMDFYFEDFVPGTILTYGNRQVSRDEIIAFAEQFDPQPFHLDETAARGSFAGELIASGWHTNALMHRMTCDAFLSRAACIGSPGINEVRWLRPVRPGERLTMRRRVVEATPSRSRADRGLVRFHYDLYNAAGDHLCHQDGMALFRKRAVADSGSAHSLTERSAQNTTPGSIEAALEAEEGGALPFFDAVTIGKARYLGHHDFSDEDIDDFARRFDNQWFHVDPALAAAGPYGGIIASGWHTASVWMGVMVRNIQFLAENARKAGLPIVKLGVSPGFRALRWLGPVRPGDRLRYFTRPLDKRVSASRPGWGLVTSESWALNQRNETVFSFVNAVFWERRLP